MKKLLFLSIVASLILNATAATVSVTAYVVDGDSGEPFPGVELFVTFENLPTKESRRLHDLTFRRITDDSGVCKFSGKTNTGKVTILTKNEGCYETWQTERFTNYVASLGRPVPDHMDVTVRVWKVGQRIPLVVRQVGRGVDAYDLDEDLFSRGNDILRFDFLKSDYLPPIGTGVVADVEFRRFVDEKTEGDKYLWYHGEMKTTFLGDGNGYVVVEPNKGSRLKIKSGVDADFQKEHTYWVRNDLTDPEFNGYTITNSMVKSRCYCFRIRTVKDDTGVVTNAYYGKIYGDISAERVVDRAIKGEARRRFVAQPEFLYYLNPTPMDKNLEFDGRHNLRPGGKKDYSFDN